MSFQINRYFDMAVDAPAAPVNIAEIMAKSGIKTESDSPGQVPDIKIEAQAETAPAPTPPVETAAAPAPAAAPPPTASPAPAVQAPEPVKVPVEPDWKEVLKKHPDTSEVLKAIGLDDKMVGFFNKWKSGESLQQYLEAVTVDYSKMAPEEVMKRHLLAEYPELAPEDMEELYRMKVIEQYKLDPDLFSAEEIKRGKILLQADAKKVREGMTASQQAYIMSKPPVPEPSQQEQEDKAAEEAALQAVATYKSQVETDAHAQALLTTKVLTVGEGEEAFKYEVANPQSYLDLLYDADKWQAKLFDEKGVPNVRKQLLLAALADDDGTFLKLLGNHYKMLGEKKAILPLENASAPVGTTSKGDAQPTDPAAALAKSGVITTG